MSIEKIEREIKASAVWINHGMVGGCYMISILKVMKIIKKEMKETE